MSLCSVPVVGTICGTAGGVATGAANDMLDAMAKTLGQGFADMVTTITTFWTKLNVPTLAGGPIQQLQGDMLWLQAVIVVATLLYAAARMAVTRSGKPAGQAAGAMILTIVATGCGLVVIDAAAAAGDGFSSWIITQSSGGDLGTRLAAIANLASLSAGTPGLVIVLAIVGIVSSLAQVALLLARIGILGVLAGTLPVISAATNTQTGRAWFQRVMGWLVAFVLYKPVAAIVYATAFYLIGDGTDITSVISGLVLMVMAVLALPALLRLVTPVVSGAMSGGSGAMALAAGSVLATGAKMLTDQHTSAPSGAAQVTGRAGLVSVGGAGGGGPSGPSGRAGSAGTLGSPGSGGGAGPAGAGAAHPAAAVFQAARLGHQAVRGAAAHATAAPGE